MNKSLKQPQAPVVGHYPATLGPLSMSYLDRQTHTSAMVEATSASIATGCPNKPRKAVQKEGKVSSSNVLDPGKHDMPNIFHAIFWLQIIYSCLRKPKKKSSQQKKTQFFKAAIFRVQKVTAVKIPNLKDFFQGGDFPDPVFSHGEGPQL